MQMQAMEREIIIVGLCTPVSRCLRSYAPIVLARVRREAPIYDHRAEKRSLHCVSRLCKPRAVSCNDTANDRKTRVTVLFTTLSYFVIEILTVVDNERSRDL